VASLYQGMDLRQVLTELLSRELARTTPALEGSLSSALIVLPGLCLRGRFLRGDLTVLADPGKYLLHHFGFVACILLATVLSFSPLRVLWPRWAVAQALKRHRRLVGVSAFVYAAISPGVPVSA